ncbi:MAG: TrmB family transcriptional regulator [Ignavibacteria bacterium]|nr:TrmB family transcriptional regulator [Ignavibacteria bacterium]
MIEKLKYLGFTDYEAKVFIALLKGSLMSASEIADDAKIRRTDVYNILKSFVEKGYSNEIETNSILKYELIDPDIILDKLERRINAKRQKELDTLKETFKELKPLHRTKESDSVKRVNIELIRGYNQHRETKFLELLKNAKKEILFMVKLEHAVMNEVDATAKKFMKNGGVIKSLYQVSDNFRIKKDNKWSKGTVSDLVKACEFFEKSGEKLRLSHSPVPNMTIFDREFVFLNITDKTLPKHNEADVLIKNKEFAENMIIVFESLWEKAQDLKKFKENL